MVLRARHDQFRALHDAIILVFSFNTLFWLAVGVFIGVGVGAMPGLTATTGVALMLPLTFTMGPAPALGLPIGLYKGAVYGGSISAISFATPGTSEAAATVFDGHKLMQRGQGRKALLIALYASVTADLLSDLITIVVAPWLALVALEFGPTERFWLMVLAVCLRGALSGPHLAKGMLSAAIGLYLGTIGSDPIRSVSRNTFDLWWLADGIHLVPLVVGIFAMGAMIEKAVGLVRESQRAHQIGDAPGCRHPLVRVHPKTGRRALFVCRRLNGYIVGLPLDESERLLDELWAHATRPEHTWWHAWKPGDLVMWDNRCTLHRRDGFDDRHTRLMHRTQLKGTEPPIAPWGETLDRSTTPTP